MKLKSGKKGKHTSGKFYDQLILVSFKQYFPVPLGIMELWNIGCKNGINPILNFIRHLYIHCSNVPLFQLGEAPEFHLDLFLWRYKT